MSDFEEFDREQEEFQEMTLDDPTTITYYKTASDISNAALERVLSAVKPGSSRYRGTLLCCFQKKKDIVKGIAHPTCVSVNSQVNYVSPSQSDDAIINEGDVVKVYLAAHINGLASHVGQTIVCLADLASPVIDRKADVLCAAHFVSEAVLRKLRPGVTNTDIESIVRKVAEEFDCHPVEGQISYEGAQWTMETNRVIPSALTPDQRVDSYELEENTAYHMSFFISTGEGKSRQADNRTTIYKRDPNTLYNLKMKTSRQVFNVIMNQFNDFAFSLRQLDDIDSKLRLGIPELSKHDMIYPYPVEEEKDTNAFVAQVSFTALILPKQTQKLLTVSQPNVVSSSKEIKDAEIVELLATEVEKKKKKVVV
ncbi:hypothetical protein GEMRC1_003935 [Eukaryota sp. GEM-RC1]